MVGAKRVPAVAPADGWSPEGPQRPRVSRKRSEARRPNSTALPSRSLASSVWLNQGSRGAMCTVLINWARLNRKKLQTAGVPPPRSASGERAPIHRRNARGCSQTPVPAPRPGSTRRAPLKSNFLADRLWRTRDSQASWHLSSRMSPKALRAGRGGCSAL